MTVIQWLAGLILVLLLLVRVRQWILACRPITDETIAEFARLIMEDNAYVLPCGGGVVYGHYQGLFWARLLYGSRHTARLCAHYLMRHGFVDTTDPDTYHMVADTPQAYADIMFSETARRGTLRELVKLRRRWASGEMATSPEPSDLARDVCERLIGRLS